MLKGTVWQPLSTRDRSHFLRSSYFHIFVRILFPEMGRQLPRLPFPLFPRVYRNTAPKVRDDDVRGREFNSRSINTRECPERED